MKRRLLSLISIYVFFISSAFAQCNISGVFAEAHPCDPNNMFLVDVDFDFINPGASNMFRILGNGNDYGTFEYGQPFYTIGPLAGNCQTIYEFVVVDIDNNDCSDFYAFNHPVCCNADCSITDISVTTLECTSDTTYAIELDFNYTGTTNNFFDVWSGNHFLGFFEFAALPVVILDFPEDGSAVDHILICENDNSNCCEDATFDALICESTADCAITDVFAEAHACDPNNLFLVDVVFNVVNPGASNMFRILGNGNDYGTFEYGQPFYTIGPLAGNCQTIYEFVVVDTDNNDCSDFYAFNHPVCCNADCSITDISVTTLECTSDTTYAIELDFNYTGTTNNFFDVWSGNHFLGFYEFTALPVVILDFPEDGSAVDHILICENDNSNCCEDATFDALICEATPDCAITDVFAEAHACDPNNLFLVDVVFNVVNPGASNMFRILGNGNDYGTFEYGQPFYTIGPLAGNCQTIYEFVVVDTDNNDCSDFYAFNHPVCCNADCSITDISVTTLECTSDTTYAIELDFNYTGTTNNFFDVWSGNHFLGFYEFTALPVVILDFPEDGSAEDHILICQNDSDCCEDATFDALICGPNTGDCSITDLLAEAYDCTPNGVFFVDVWFNYSNPGPSNTFTISGNGTNYGIFEYGQPFYTVGPLVGDCETLYEFIVHDVDFNDCASNYFEFEEPFCCGNEPDCNIHDISVITLECTSDSTYAIQLDFEYVGTTNDHFEVWSGNHYLGTFLFADLPLTITDFPEDGSAEDHILICENDNSNCCEDATFDALICGPNTSDCSITDLLAEAYDCTPNGVFFVDVWFNYSNTGPSNTFTISGNGTNYGTFEYGQPFYTIGPLVGDCETLYEFIVHDVDFNDCASNYFEFEEPFCCGNEPDCNIHDISVITLECTSDSTYAIQLDFEYVGTTNDHFEVWSGNHYLGTFLFADLPLTITDFPEDGSAEDHILICENDSDCCEDAIFNALECGPSTGDCSITNLTAVQHDCDANGQFLVDISFAYANPGPSNTFTINGNATHYGTFEYGLDFYTIGPLDADCETIYEFIVHDTDLNNCSSGYIHFDAPVCCELPQCLIYNMTVDTIECTGDNQYAILLNFEYQETSNIGFDVYSNGNFIGFYTYDLLPLTITDFPSNGGNTDIIEVCDNDNMDCCMAMEFPAIDCTPEPCLFDNVMVTATPCDGLFFNFEIDFDPGGGNGNSFSVLVNNQIFSPLSYNDLPVSVGPLEGDNNTFYELLLSDLEHPNCALQVNYGTVDCGSNFQGLTNIELVSYQNGNSFYVRNSKHPIPANSRYIVYDLTGKMINEGDLEAGIGTQEIEISTRDTRMVLINFVLENHSVTNKMVVSR